MVFEDIYDAKNAQEHLTGYNVHNRYINVLFYSMQRELKKKSLAQVIVGTIDCLPWVFHGLAPVPPPLHSYYALSWCVCESGLAGHAFIHVACRACAGGRGAAQAPGEIRGRWSAAPPTEMTEKFKGFVR